MMETQGDLPNKKVGQEKITNIGDESPTEPDTASAAHLLDEQESLPAANEEGDDVPLTFNRQTIPSVFVGEELQSPQIHFLKVDLKKVEHPTLPFEDDGPRISTHPDASSQGDVSSESSNEDQT